MKKPPGITGGGRNEKGGEQQVLMTEKMSPEEQEQFCERWVRMQNGFECLPTNKQTKVVNLAAKLLARRIIKLSPSRLMALKRLCRNLSEKDEMKIAELIEKESARL